MGKLLFQVWESTRSQFFSPIFAELLRQNPVLKAANSLGRPVPSRMAEGMVVPSKSEPRRDDRHRCDQRM